jgi:sigma-B regulation protein RsbU (phosphoserine phosphatase)
MPNRPLTVLLVEDNPGDARLIVEDLREPDVAHRVIQAGRLDDALRRLHEDQEGGIDVIILDLSLPDARELEAVEQIRVAAPRLPIVVLTGLDDEAFAFRAVEEGVQDYLVKGKVNGSVLVRALRYAIERKRADEAARREEEAARASTLRETIMGIVGHDLRVPLQSIAASADLLLRAHDLAPQHAAAVQRIAKSSDRMARMLGSLLDFAQARLGGGYTLAESEHDLQDVCRQAVDEIGREHPGRTIQLATNGSGKGRWDRNRITQVVSELVRNAARHAPDGSPVKVAVHDEGAAIVLVVHNDGQPIPPEVQSRLFEPFYRGDDASGGLGLGLYVIQQIVVGHRGTIEARSVEGEGTTLTVRLPRG